MNSLLESPGAWVRNSGWLNPSVTTGTNFMATCPPGGVVVVVVRRVVVVVVRLVVVVGAAAVSARARKGTPPSVPW